MGGGGAAVGREAMDTPTPAPLLTHAASAVAAGGGGADDYGGDEALPAPNPVATPGGGGDGVASLS